MSDKNGTKLPMHCPVINVIKLINIIILKYTMEIEINSLNKRMIFQILYIDNH